MTLWRMKSKSLMLIANSTQLCSFSGKTRAFQGFQEIIQGKKKTSPRLRYPSPVFGRGVGGEGTDYR